MLFLNKMNDLYILETLLNKMNDLYILETLLIFIPIDLQ